MVDEELLDKGADFESLKESYVIFISPFDKFGRKLIRYTFRNRCDEDKELELMDGAVKVFINAAGIREGADPDFAAFLDLMLGKKTSNRFADRVQEAVDIVKLDKEGRHRYMTVEMWIREEAKIAATEAAEKAAKEAHEEDAEIIAALTSENDSLVSENEKLRAELAKYKNPDEK
jgi:predicted transposase/invertase (TIGR01784 family)